MIWKDRENYLRLDRGTRGPDEITFMGRVAGENWIVGRGRLSAERVFLRLERIGGQVNAFCSADGREWFTLGSAIFPVDDSVEVGLNAIGRIDRTLYPGARPEENCVLFESLDLWLHRSAAA